MNPSIPTDYHETGAWLVGFVRSHAKRENARIEVLVDTSGPREGRSRSLNRIGVCSHPSGLFPSAITGHPVVQNYREALGGDRRL